MSTNEQDSLRSEAEAQLSHAPQTEVPARSAEELLHELRVHQIELEMQNEELRQAQLRLEESRDRYVDLYEFAPSGYLTLARDGTITEANLTGAALLGVERKKLLKRRIANFVSAEYADRWHRHFMDVLLREGRQNCELEFQCSEGSRFHARLDSLRTCPSPCSGELKAWSCLHPQTGATACVRIALTDITERKHAERQLRELSAHLHTVREEEKASVARDIHDELGGTLAALKMDAYWLTQQLEAGTAPLEHAEAMYGLLDDAVKAVRRIITDLRPSMLDDLGLLATLEWQCVQFQKRTGIECRISGVKVENGEDELDQVVSINLFRIFQEMLTNVARHSGASRVEAELRQDGENVILSISDNGCGLPQGHVIAATSFGIRGMRERVEQLGGKIELVSQPGMGLSVTVVLPLPDRQ